jgi:hypothetical protein
VIVAEGQVIQVTPFPPHRAAQDLVQHFEDLVNSGLAAGDRQRFKTIMQKQPAEVSALLERVTAREAAGLVANLEPMPSDLLQESAEIRGFSMKLVEDIRSRAQLAKA